MAVHMRSINVQATARKAPVRGIPATEGLKCHGCPEFECMQTKLVTKPWRFHCDKLHRDIDPLSVECRDRGALTERGFEKLGDWLHRRRLEEGLSADALGRMAGIAGQTVTRYERGVMKPRKRTLCKIEAVLGKWPCADGSRC